MLWLTQQQLKSKNVETRRKAVAHLGIRPGPRAVGVLRAALDDGDATVRRLATMALSRIEDESRLDPLLVALNDRDPEVLKAAIAGLKSGPGERLIPPLTRLLRHSDAGVRGQAAHLLEALGWHPAKREEELWLSVAKGKFSWAADLGVEAIPALEAVVNSGPYSLCMGAVQALGEIGDPKVLRPLLTALHSGDANVCVTAVDALARLGGPQVIEPIMGMLRHRNGQVRLAAVEAFASFGPGAQPEPLRPLLRDSYWDVRRAASETLGRLKDRGSVEALTGALNDPDADVREATAMALGNIRERSAIGALVMTLKDESSGVRRLAAAALSCIDENWSTSSEARSAAEQLRPLLHAIDSDVRYFVTQLLSDLGAAPPATPDSPLPQPIAEPSAPGDSPNLEKRQRLAVSLFLAILCDADRDLRLAAVQALGRLGDRRAESALTRALQDSDECVREATGASLRALRGN